jgi:hypothetical protein
MKIWLIVIGLLILPQLASGQFASQQEIDLSVRKIAALLNETYVHADQGEIFARRLLAKHKDGFFKKVRTWSEFDSLCTSFLQKISEDGHVFVRYDPARVAALNAAPRAEKVSARHPFYYSEKAVSKNFGFAEVRIMSGNIGWIRIDEINLSERSLPVLYAAMEFVSRTRALVIDLRTNGGGGSAVGCVIETFFLEKDIDLLEVHRRGMETMKLGTVPWLLEPQYDKPVFVLISSKTASAAEAIAFNLKRHKRAVIVGQRSAGAAHMNSLFPVNDNIFVSISTAAPTVPGTTENWERQGIDPDYVTEPGKEVEMVDSLLVVEP